MGTHGAHRVAEGGAVLDGQAVHRVRVVAAPDLGRVVKHPGVKPPASAGAALDQQIRVAAVEPFQKFIQPQHIPVQNRTAAVPVPCGGPDVADAPVHIPFQIFDVGAV